MKRLLVLSAGFLAIGMTWAPAYFDGQRRFRWGRDLEVAALAGRLEEFPKRLGDWESTADLGMDPSSAAMLRPFAAVNRIYFNAAQQRSAHVFILFGPTGPTAVHTPEVCIDARGFQKIGPRQPVSIGQQGSESFVSRFKSAEVNHLRLLSIYAWTVDGKWLARSEPRYYFARSRYLYKVQIASLYIEGDQAQDQVLYQFAADIETELKRLL